MVPNLPDAHSILIQNAVQKIQELTENKLEWVILYGSYSTGEQREDSDIDLCVYMEAGKDERFRVRINIQGSLGDRFDVQMFQDLPVYVRMEILKGKVIFCRDMSQLNDIVYSTIMDYNLFEPSYKLYLGASDY